MNIPIYHVNAFTHHLFAGNPAAVCVMPDWPSEAMLTNIAVENNLPATAFVVAHQNKYSIRWITPEYELDLCGHGTLAAGFIIFNFIQPSLETITLQSRIETLHILRHDNMITLDFPVKSFAPNTPPDLLTKGLNATPREYYSLGEERCLLIFEDEDEIKKLRPDMQVLKQLAFRGITVTAKGSGDIDFVSRSFYPKKSISEDPATGSSHCLLVPYWAERLGKSTFHALQLSKRGGEMFCELKNDRVYISGHAVLYSRGEIYLGQKI